MGFCTSTTVWRIRERRTQADALRGDETTITDHLDEVSVLFADIVGFSPMSESMEAVAVVELLNTVFSRFVGLVEGHAVEKVRTIGDNYMVVAGAPRPRPDHGDCLQFRIGTTAGRRRRA